MDAFEAIFLAGFVVSIIIRSYYGKQFKAKDIILKMPESPLVYVGIVLWSVVLLLPFISIFSGWLRFADYPLSEPLRIIGGIIITLELWLLWRCHVDLGQNFSPSLFIRNEHTLVTDGVYSRIRHPMYLAFLMWAVGQALLIDNWIAGPLGLIAFILIYLFRIEREEQQLVEVFGERYRCYQQVTGRLLPRFK